MVIYFLGKEFPRGVKRILSGLHGPPDRRWERNLAAWNYFAQRRISGAARAWREWSSGDEQANEQQTADVESRLHRLLEVGPIFLPDHMKEQVPTISQLANQAAELSERWTGNELVEYDVRHGVSHANDSRRWDVIGRGECARRGARLYGTPLHPAGYQQAALAGQYLHSEGIFPDRVVASGYPRANATAGVACLYAGFSLDQIEYDWRIGERQWHHYPGQPMTTEHFASFFEWDDNAPLVEDWELFFRRVWWEMLEIYQRAMEHFENKSSPLVQVDFSHRMVIAVKHVLTGQWSWEQAQSIPIQNARVVRLDVSRVPNWPACLPRSS